VGGLLDEALDGGLGPELLAGPLEQPPEQLLARVAQLRLLPSTFAWTRTTVERRARAGFAARSSSTARMSVVLPEPEEPMRRMLPTRRRASFLASATDISRTASFWPITFFSRAWAIWAGDGGRTRGDSTLSPVC